MSEFTGLSDGAASVEPVEAAAIFPLVYGELKKLASAKMVAENPGHTLDATALVHEAYVRLTRRQSFASESHFLRAAAESMRRILVDHARSRNAAKRGSGRRVDVDPGDHAAQIPDGHLEELDEACRAWRRKNPNWRNWSNSISSGVRPCPTPRASSAYPPARPILGGP